MYIDMKSMGFIWFEIFYCVLWDERCWVAKWKCSSWDDIAKDEDVKGYRIYWEYLLLFKKKKFEKGFFLLCEKWKMEKFSCHVDMLTASSNKFYFTSFLLISIFLKKKKKKIFRWDLTDLISFFSKNSFCFICVKFSCTAIKNHRKFKL